jgi:serine/threonine-protein kinase
MRHMLLSSGANFAGYTVVRPLGSGGMGDVYLVRHPRLPREDALKILPAEVSVDPQFRERFNREADLASALYHPHIVGVHDRGEFEGQLWITMDFVDGPDAGRLLRGQYPNGMPTRDVVKIVNAVAEALDYAHKRGMLHRDVKPANILVTDPESDSQRVLLADFGIARRLDEVSGLTATNMTVGTLHYAAPEQLMGGDIDGRSDQYALAATAFHLLTGEPPFDHSNPAVLISRHIGSEPPSLAAARPDVAQLDPVIAIAMAKQPTARYENCLAFATALDQAGSTYLSETRTDPAYVTVSAPRLGAAYPVPQTVAAPLPKPWIEETATERPDAVPPVPARAEKFVDQRDMPPIRLRALVLALLFLILMIVGTLIYVQSIRAQRSSLGPPRALDHGESLSVTAD